MRSMRHFMLHDHSELAAAITMAAPSIVCVWFLLQAACRTATCLAATGCFLHFPFSFMLHMYKAVSTDTVLRARLFKLDICFIHIHSFITGCAWAMRPQYFEILFHGYCLLNIIIDDPLAKPAIKKRWDMCTVLGIMKSSFGMVYRNPGLWVLAHVFWIAAFLIYSRKLCGTANSAIMHSLLSVPQFCILASLQWYDA